MIERHYNTVAVAYRLAGSSNDTREYSSTAAVTTNGILLPAGIEDEALLEGSYSEVRKFLCPVVDIRKSDKIVIAGTNYYVGGLKKYDNAIGSNQHLELIIYDPN